jgi:hypothetical protein
MFTSGPFTVPHTRLPKFAAVLVTGGGMGSLKAAEDPASLAPRVSWGTQKPLFIGVSSGFCVFSAWFGLLAGSS